MTPVRVSAAPSNETRSNEAAGCPTRSTVAGAVRALLRSSHVDLTGVETEIELTDAGSRFTVSIRGRTREYADAARDCRERTRTAAVFVALTLSPPDIGPNSDEPSPEAVRASGARAPTTAEPAATSEETPDADPATAAAAPPSTPATASETTPKQADPERPRNTSAERARETPAAGAIALPESTGARGPPVEGRAIALELGVLGAFAPSSEVGQWVGGADLRAAVTFERWGLSAGLSLPSPSTLDASGLKVKQERFSADAGLRLLWRGARLSGAFDLGVLTATYRLTRDGVTSSGGERRIELGLRAGASMELLPGSVTPFLRLFSEIVPVTREIVVEPRGVVGATPPLWLGGAVGIAGKFR